MSASLVLLGASCSSAPTEGTGTEPSGAAGMPNSVPAVAGNAGKASVPAAGSGGLSGIATQAPRAGAGAASGAGAGPRAGSMAAAGSGGSASAQAGRAAAPPAAAAGTDGSELASAAGANASAGMGGDVSSLGKFSFFVTSLAGLQRLSKSEDGFGGDLRYGESDGLSGADKICSELAEASMPGAAAKGWRAFLSVAEGPEGGPVHAIDRIGEGPWYDRLERVLAMNKAALLNTRPMGADPAIINDLPNEDGVPNHQPDPGMQPVNNHHFLTGSDSAGKLYMNRVTSTCDNWTSTAASAGRPRIGFSYPAGNRQHWLSGQDEGGCGAGIVLQDRGGSDPSNPIVGSGGGYGGFYCFALQP